MLFIYVTFKSVYVANIYYTLSLFSIIIVLYFKLMLAKYNDSKMFTNTLLSRLKTEINIIKINGYLTN